MHTHKIYSYFHIHPPPSQLATTLPSQSHSTRITPDEGHGHLGRLQFLIHIQMPPVAPQGSVCSLGLVATDGQVFISYNSSPSLGGTVGLLGGLLSWDEPLPLPVVGTAGWTAGPVCSISHPSPARL